MAMLPPQWVETTLELSMKLATCTHLVSCSNDMLSYDSCRTCEESTITCSSPGQFMNMFVCTCSFDLRLCLPAHVSQQAMLQIIQAVAS